MNKIHYENALKHQIYNFIMPFYFWIHSKRNGMKDVNGNVHMGSHMNQLSRSRALSLEFLTTILVVETSEQTDIKAL
jgi:hypothetical protein